MKRYFSNQKTYSWETPEGQPNSALLLYLLLEASGIKFSLYRYFASYEIVSPNVLFEGFFWGEGDIFCTSPVSFSF